MTPKRSRNLQNLACNFADPATHLAVPALARCRRELDTVENAGPARPITNSWIWSSKRFNTSFSILLRSSQIYGLRYSLLKTFSRVTLSEDTGTGTVILKIRFRAAAADNGISHLTEAEADEADGGAQKSSRGRSRQENKPTTFYILCNVRPLTDAHSEIL